MTKLNKLDKKDLKIKELEEVVTKQQNHIEGNS